MVERNAPTPVDEATTIAAEQGKRASDIDSAAELVETLFPGAARTVDHLREVARRLRGEPATPEAPSPYAAPTPAPVASNEP